MGRSGPFEWKNTILVAYSALGGEADNQELYRWLEANADIPAHLLNEVSYGRPKYRHAVRSYLTDLCEDGKLERVGPKGSGRYRIIE